MTIRKLSKGERARIEKLVTMADAGEALIVICACSPHWDDGTGGQICSNANEVEQIIEVLERSALALSSGVAEQLDHEELKRREEH